MESPQVFLGGRAFHAEGEQELEQHLKTALDEAFTAQELEVNPQEGIGRPFEGRHVLGASPWPQHNDLVQLFFPKEGVPVVAKVDLHEAFILERYQPPTVDQDIPTLMFQCSESPWIVADLTCIIGPNKLHDCPNSSL